MLQTERYAPNASLILSRQGIVGLGRKGPVSLHVIDCLILEQFVHGSAALLAYRNLLQVVDLLGGFATLDPKRTDVLDDAVAVSLRRSVVFASTTALMPESKRLADISTRSTQLFPNSPGEDPVAQYATEKGINVMTTDSRRGLFVTLDLAQRLGLQEWLPALDGQAFSARVRKLVDDGFLTKCIGDVTWGDFALRTPLCADYGYSRGTPLDRYYLDRFLRSIAGDVRGNVLEIGGCLENRARYGFEFASDYSCLNIAVSPSSGDRYICGDAHDGTLFNEMTFDVILAFNVLEHCKRPWDVLRNIHKWLKSGGCFFGGVPASQRIHRDPEDHWRILPDAFLEMLGPFTHVDLVTFGNIKGCIASLYGIAAEELTDEDRDLSDPSYPVFVCVTARKN